MIFGNFTPDYLRVNLIWDNLHIDNSTLDGSGSSDAATSDGQYIIGAPGDNSRP
ncbi:MAG: hypothetical protein KH026_05050 [Clostridium sp.]|nr:hypothetical protein [Clostridium sp.]